MPFLLAKNQEIHLMKLCNCVTVSLRCQSITVLRSYAVTQFH